MTVIIIPYGNKGKYNKIVGAKNLDVSMPLSGMEDIISIGGGRELFFLEDVDDWNGNLNELRKKADEITFIDTDGTKQCFKKKTLIDKIKKYLPLIRK